MAWIKSETSAIRNHKVLRLALELEIKPAYALGHLHSLWHNVLELREDGDITVWSNKEIAHYAGYEGNADKFVECLSKGFIDTLNGMKLIHDWLFYALPYLQAKYRSHNKGKLQEIETKYKEWSDRTVVLDKIDKIDKIREDKINTKGEKTAFSFLENKDFKQMFNDYLEMRIKIKRPATNKAKELILKKLHKVDIKTAIAMLEQSIVSSWQDVFPLRKENNGKVIKGSNPAHKGKFAGYEKVV